jgi:hypothetical protein
MTTRTTTRTIGFFTLAAMVLATGCSARLSQYMQAFDEPEVMVPPPGLARVVFLRPSSGAFQRIVTLVNEHGHYLGDSSAGTRFSVFPPPGDHYFIAMTDGAETLKATLAPGRTYYVELRPKLGVWTPQVPLLAISRRSGLRRLLPDFLTHTWAAIPDFQAGEAHLRELGSQAPATVRRGIRAHEGYSPELKAAATLVPEDGE